MTNTSSPRFEAPRDALAGWMKDIIRLVLSVAGAADLEHLLVGAVARDLVLHGVFGLSEGRQTLDLDFGFAVRDWPQYDDLKSRLLRSGNFTAHPRLYHRLIYTREAEHPLDLIPFQGVEDDSGRIAWPPGGETVMNVAGFDDALASALAVQLGADLTVQVASVSGLALMKFLAWEERGEESNRDADDLHRLLDDYGRAGNEGRLYGEESRLLEEAKYDFELAGARLLGRDAAAIASRETAVKITAILQSEAQMHRLVAHMLRAAPSFEDTQPQRYLDLLLAFRNGFQGA